MRLATVGALLAATFSVGYSPQEVLAQDAVARGLTVPRVSGYAEIAVADKYIYQGFIVEARGPVVQPYIELYGEFYKGDGLLTSASLKLSVFNSVQFHNSGRTNLEDPMRTWYELEIKSGFEFVLAKQLTVSAVYRRFESPNGQYRSANGIEMGLAFDDSELLGAFALHPRATWIMPIGGDVDEGGEEGHYFELGIEPSVVLAEKARYPVTIALPVTVGFGDHRYYYGRHFGFASAGLSVSVPLAFLPESCGKWNLAATGAYYRLGQTAADLTNGGDEHETVIAALLTVEF